MSTLISLLRGRRLLIFPALGLIWLLWRGVLPNFTPENTVLARQHALFAALEDGDDTKLLSMVSDDYLDDFKFNRDEFNLALKDCRSLFRTFGVEVKDESVELQGKEAAVTISCIARGQILNPMGDWVLAQSREVKKPYVFRFRKESIWGWGWRLVKVEQPDLKLPAGYKPGAVRDGSAINEALGKMMSP